MAQPPLPEIVKKHFQEKHGYANYYFNRLNQERVWKAWNARANLAGAGDAWTLAGQLDNGGAFRFELTDSSASLKLPATESTWTASDEFNASLLPAHSGGLLPALYLWRRLAVEGLARFGDVDYYGTAPLPGREGLVDVLVGSHKGVECRFYFDPANGNLLALEMFPDDDSDPCEVYFADYREKDGRVLPGRMEVRYGNDPFAVFKLSEFTLRSGGPRSENRKSPSPESRPVGPCTWRVDPIPRALPWAVEFRPFGRLSRIREVVSGLSSSAPSGAFRESGKLFLSKFSWPCC